MRFHQRSVTILGSKNVSYPFADLVQDFCRPFIVLHFFYRNFFRTRRTNVFTSWPMSPHHHQHSQTRRQLVDELTHPQAVMVGGGVISSWIWKLSWLKECPHDISLLPITFSRHQLQFHWEKTKKFYFGVSQWEELLLMLTWLLVTTWMCSHISFQKWIYVCVGVCRCLSLCVYVCACVREERSVPVWTVSVGVLALKEVMLWHILLTAYQLLMEYFILLEALDRYHNYIFNTPLHFNCFFYLSVIICLHTVIWYKVFLSNTNNLHQTVSFQVFVSNTDNL